MVLVQEDEDLQEHVIYYLSQNLIDAEIHYSHVEKFSLATVHTVKWLRHYILLRQTLVVANVNPFQGKLQKDLDYAHIPMYTVLVVKPAYIRAYRLKIHVYHFSYVFRDDQGNIEG